MAVSRALLLVCALAASVEGWSATPRAPVAAPLARSATAAVARPAAAAVRMEEKKSFLPFFLDVNTKGGIVFYSIVGIVAPFWAYGQMIDSWGFDVVTAGNVILIGYVGAGIVGWTSTCAARGTSPSMPAQPDKISHAHQTPIIEIAPPAPIRSSTTEPAVELPELTAVPNVEHKVGKEALSNAKATDPLPWVEQL